MTEHDYLLAWSLYGAAALGCLLVWLRMTGWLWRWLREPLRVIMAVLLFSPTVVDPAKEQFAPAIAITALDGRAAAAPHQPRDRVNRMTENTGCLSSLAISGVPLSRARYLPVRQQLRPIGRNRFSLYSP